MGLSNTDRGLIGMEVCLCMGVCVSLGDRGSVGSQGERAAAMAWGRPAGRPLSFPLAMVWLN